MLYIIDALLFWGPYIIAAVVIVFVIIRFFIRVTKRINKNEGMTKEELKYEVQDGINTVVENSQLIGGIVGDVSGLVDCVKGVCEFEGDYPKYPCAEDYINVDDNSKYGHVTTMYQGSNWKCPKCSRSNRAYVGSCACGFNKREKK